MKAHKLKIESLRDLVATCTCGKWHLAKPTSDRESNAAIKAWAEAQFRRHIHTLVKLCYKPPNPCGASRLNTAEK